VACLRSRLVLSVQLIGSAFGAMENKLNRVRFGTLRSVKLKKKKHNLQAASPLFLEGKDVSNKCDTESQSIFVGTGALFWGPREIGPRTEASTIKYS
jgi:hypothetical protein